MKVLNEFVKNENISSVLEFGCGDGNVLGMVDYPEYIGLDVSKSAVEYVKQKFSQDANKQFYLVDYFLESKGDFIAELTLSLDVIFHLVEDDVFNKYMRNLFKHSKRFVGIYSSNKNELHTSHVRHRKFDEWIEANAKEWRLYKFTPNKYPFDCRNPNHTSFCDFYFYRKLL